MTNSISVEAISKTYAIPSDIKGDICINGAAAHLVNPGDLVIIVSYALMSEEDAQTYKPTVILLDEKNNIKWKYQIFRN